MASLEKAWFAGKPRAGLFKRAEGATTRSNAMSQALMIDPAALYARLGSATSPRLFDVRRRDAFEPDERTLPGARWRDPARVGDWAALLPRDTPIVAYCVHGHQVSQSVAAELRAMGLDAQALSGGIEEWRKAGLPTIKKRALPGRDELKPSRWVTRIHPKIDRIACPWLIRRFIDPEAVFLFVSPEEVVPAARDAGAIPYDVEGVDITHEGDGCSFDTLIARFGLEDPLLAELARIVRGADTGRPDLAPQAPGLLAMSLGLSRLCGDDDHAAVERGALFYDTLYAWLREARAEKHGWPPRRA
jgi:rhodanese-related sulfurtransferase